MPRSLKLVPPSSSSSTPQTIQIFGMDYWPDATGIAPYTTGLAEYLAREGNQVDVIAGMPYYPEWSVKSGYERSLRRMEVRNGVTIHRARQFVPRRQSALRRAAFEGTFLLNAGIGHRTPRPDVVIGIVPALSNGVLAARRAASLGVPLVLIIQDLLGQAAVQSGVDGGQRIAEVTSKLEGWIARQAAAIGIVASGFRPPLERMGVDPSRIHSIRNWTHIQQVTADRAKTRTGLGLPLTAPIVLHAGNMGLKQGLDNMIEAARLAVTSAPEILFVLMGDGNQRSHLEELASGLPNVRFIDPQSNEDFPNILAAADVLLVNQLPSVVDMSLPSKLTSYFAVERPVLAAVASNSETAKVVAESGGGRVVPAGDPAALVDELIRVTRSSELAASLGLAGKLYAQDHLSAEGALRRLDMLIRGEVPLIARATGAEEALAS